MQVDVYKVVCCVVNTVDKYINKYMNIHDKNNDNA